TTYRSSTIPPVIPLTSRRRPTATNRTAACVGPRSANGPIRHVDFWSGVPLAVDIGILRLLVDLGRRRRERRNRNYPLRREVHAAGGRCRQHELHLWRLCRRLAESRRVHTHLNPT